ncbi:hypothetical protein [Candidatus Parabeggiatoa sp. HSG14]|uniref:hypothetical protein n=1 Tax=Candidatus Parabeggiatoa sp. HSG14 TaxID=3055593 RepID=UPI0025A75C95|nr:hypothetical protein [Thiotrichales bacterium HSG14]
MQLKSVALLAGLLPLVSGHLVYLTAAHFELVSWCIPYLEGCTSISKTGRYSPANYIFRATMIPSAIFMMIYWKLISEWLIVMGDKKKLYNHAILYLGIIAAIFLILYVTALGSEGQIYRLLRRYGVIIFFAFTYLAQLLLIYRLFYLVKHLKVNLPSYIYKTKLTLCVVQLVIGLISLPVRAFYDGNDFNSRVENIVEWNFALMMILYFVVTYFAWQATAFEANFSVKRK